MNLYLIKLFSKFKMAIRKGHMSFLLFHFWDLKLVPIGSALNSASGTQTHFFKKMYAWYQEKQPNLKIRDKIFLKCLLWSMATKLENFGTKIDSQEVDQESCRWQRICQMLILTLWLVTPPRFLAKVEQILQKVILFFRERGEEMKPSFWHV